MALFFQWHLRSKYFGSTATKDPILTVKVSACFNHGACRMVRQHLQPLPILYRHQNWQELCLKMFLTFRNQQFQTGAGTWHSESPGVWRWDSKQSLNIPIRLSFCSLRTTTSVISQVYKRVKHYECLWGKVCWGFHPTLQRKHSEQLKKRLPSDVDGRHLAQSRPSRTRSHLNVPVLFLSFVLFVFSLLVKHLLYLTLSFVWSNYCLEVFNHNFFPFALESCWFFYVRLAKSKL